MTHGAPLAVMVQGLYKSFGTTQAVRHVDLAVPAGSFFGLVGQNGAGKTTTLRMITGLLRPDAGHVNILGHPVWPDTSRSKEVIGVLPEDLPLFDRLTGAQLLEYTGLLRGMSPDEVAKRSAELLDVLDLTAAGDQLVVDYSQGMRKKMGLGCALLHAPKVLFLDEPFESVDPVASRTIRELLQRYTRSGNTVVFSSHVMALVEALCDHVAIVHQGTIVSAGTLEHVRGDETLEQRFIDLVGGAHLQEGTLSWLDTSSG